jgi:hypothetical protein
MKEQEGRGGKEGDEGMGSWVMNTSPDVVMGDVCCLALASPSSPRHLKG